MRRLVPALFVLAACAHTAPAAPSPPVAIAPAPVPPASPPALAQVDEGVRLEAMLAASGLSYVTVEAGRMWMIGFSREGVKPVVVHVVRGDAYTMIMGRLGAAPARDGFFRHLARRNFEVPQLKLGVDAHDGVYAAFEVPSRLVDREELLEDVFTLARTLDELRDALMGTDDPEVPRPPPPAPILEAMRRVNLH